MKIRKLLSGVMAIICCAGMAAGLSACKPPEQTEQSGENNSFAENEVPAVADEIDTEMTPLEFTSKIKVGWNLGNTLDATGNSGINSEISWGAPVTSEENMLTVKQEGFNAVRIPTTWFNHMDENHTIDAEWMNRVREVVDYAYKNDLYVILNMHHEDWNYPYEDNKETAAAILTTAWTQIAEQFKGYDEHLIFEGMNEPRWVGTPEEWSGGNDEGRSVVNYFNQVFVDTVRATGGNNEYRFLMVCPYAANSSEETMAALELPEDPANRLIVSVHAYTPYSFALQQGGSSKWLADRPNCTRDIDTLADALDRLFISQGTAVIIGETGAMSKDNEEFRAEWAEYFTSKFKALGVPCFFWDNGAIYSGETFGLLDRRNNTWYFPELMDAIMRGAEAQQ